MKQIDELLKIPIVGGDGGLNRDSIATLGDAKMYKTTLVLQK